MLTITKENIDNHRETIDESITEIYWEAGPLDGSVIMMFPFVTILYCSYNQLTTLKGIEQCPRLQELYCSSNQLTSLTGIEQCTQLQILYCWNNQLISLTGIEQCTQLQILDCSRNQLTTLTGIEHCTLLQELYCWNNQLISLTGIEHCTQLQELDCYSNQLTSLNQIVYLRQLGNLNYSGNPLEIQTVQVQRFLARLDARRTNTNNSIYSDRQNVHDSTIQKSVCDSIQNLLKDPESEFSIETIINSDLNQKTKQLLVEYCEDKTEHSHHLITYAELLSYVWARIIGSDHASELFKILEEQINDSECKCFTGRFNRTLSVLVGFCSDIQIEISNNSRISAIILATKEKINPYDSIKHRELAYEQLTEAGYDKDTIEPWLDAIE